MPPPSSIPPSPSRFPCFTPSSSRLLATRPPGIPISLLLTGNSSTPTSDSVPPANLDKLVAVLHDRAVLPDAPPLIIESLSHVADYFGSQAGPTAHHSVNPDPLIQPQNPTMRQNVYTSSKTTLSVLYTYEDVNAWVEYLETSPNQPVGYLFCCDPPKWENLVRNFAYSLGKPSGQTIRGQEREHPLLVDRQGRKVPCVVSHLTCMKFCSWALKLYCTEIQLCQAKAQRFAQCRTSCQWNRSTLQQDMRTSWLNCN